MNLETYRNYCLQKKGARETFPFDQETIVYKVGGKMFALANIEHFRSINVKCDPEKALELRSRYSAVLPGWHMNKKHWNTIRLDDDSITDAQIFEWIDHSYALVFAKLPKATQAMWT